MTIPLPVITGAYRVALKWVNTSQTAVNVIHIFEPGGGGASPTAIFTCLDTHVTAGMWGTCAGGAVTEVDITPLDGVSATASFNTASPSKWSGGTDTDFTPAAAALIKLQTGLRGRDNRGRIYLPWLSEAQVTKGVLNGTTASDRTANWTTFASAIAADGTTPCHLAVASYDRAHAGAGAHITSIVTLAMEGAIATQRRRQGRLR